MNRVLGNSFEQEFAQMLFAKGCWVHILTQNKAGQPADIIATYRGRAFLIDCKVCIRDKFPLSRIEPNQHLAMSLWKYINESDALFALKLTDGIFIIKHSTLVKLANDGKKVIKLDEIEQHGVSFDEWFDSEVYKCE